MWVHGIYIACVFVYIVYSRLSMHVFRIECLERETQREKKGKERDSDSEGGGGEYRLKTGDPICTYKCACKTS